MRVAALLFGLFGLAAFPALSETEPPGDVSGTWQLDGIYTVIGEDRLHECAPHCDKVIPLCRFEQTKEKFTGLCKGPMVEGSVEGRIHGKQIQFVWTHFTRSSAVENALARGMDPGREGQNRQQLSFKGEVDHAGLIAGTFVRRGRLMGEGTFIATRQ